MVGNTVFYFAVTSCVLLAGCGAASSGDDKSGSPLPEPKEVAAALDPCALVAPEEVASVTGEKVLRASRSGQICTYETEDSAATVTLQAKLHGGSEEMAGVRGANKFLGNLGGQFKGQEGAAGDIGNALSSDPGAPQIGDEASFDASQTLHVRKGEAYISVAPPIMRSRMSEGMPLLSSEQRRTIAAEIARKAVGKL